jgi:hypothetical protein
MPATVVSTFPPSRPTERAITRRPAATHLAVAQRPTARADRHSGLVTRRTRRLRRPLGEIVPVTDSRLYL